MALARNTALEGIGESAGFFSWFCSPCKGYAALQVYYDDRNVDDDLVRSIVLPAENPNASEVFYRVISATGSSVNSLLGELQVPLMLLWGDKDPWIGPASADKIMALYPSATRVRLTAGHCPHDDAPGLVNEALLKWVGEL